MYTVNFREAVGNIPYNIRFVMYYYFGTIIHCSFYQVKEPGTDGTPSEIWQAIEEDSILTMPTNLENKNSSQLIGRDQSTFQYQNCCTISLISFVICYYKILLRIIQPYIKLKPYIEKDTKCSSWFWKKSRNTKQYYCMHWINEKAKEYQKEVNICFVNFSRL